MKVGGYAAGRIAETLKKKGGNLVMPPEGFFVKGKEGPLKEGELERTANWGEVIVRVKKVQQRNPVCGEVGQHLSGQTRDR